MAATSAGWGRGQAMLDRLLGCGEKNAAAEDLGGLKMFVDLLDESVG